MWMVVVIGTFAVLPPGVVSAQEFDCGSNGSDGALDFVTGSTDPVTIEFDPTSFDPPLDQDRDGVYHFTTITVPANVTVKLRADKVGWTPIYRLARDVD